MERIFRLCLLIAGIINILPALLTFLPEKISESYGVTIADANDELLLRHRAVLFGIIGSYMIYSAISKKNYFSAVLMGMISMISFIILFFIVNGEVNAELTKVMKIDIAAIVILLIGYVCLKFK